MMILGFTGFALIHNMYRLPCKPFIMISSLHGNLLCFRTYCLKGTAFRQWVSFFT